MNYTPINRPHATRWTIDQDLLLLRMVGRSDRHVATAVNAIGPVRTSEAVRQRRKDLRNYLNQDPNFLDPKAAKTREQNRAAPHDNQVSERKDMVDRSERFRVALLKAQLAVVRSKPKAKRPPQMMAVLEADGSARAVEVRG